jgi:hypothetical protein
VLPLTEGVIPHQAPEAIRPAVRIQGAILAKNTNGDRLVTLFLINAQEEGALTPTAIPRGCSSRN